MLSPKRARLQVSLCCDPADFIRSPHEGMPSVATGMPANGFPTFPADKRDRKSTRLNSSHVSISYAVFCLKKKKKTNACSKSHSQTAMAYTIIHQPTSTT